MGCNYYIEDKKCCECGQSEKFHIGKKSWGWEFSFQAWSSSEFREIKSWDDWKKVIREYGSVINEYGSVLNAEEFIELVEDSREDVKNPITKVAKTPHNHYDYCVEVHSNIVDCLMWKDEEGWSFTHSEFL
jgi:hypothetical protein